MHRFSDEEEAKNLALKDKELLKKKLFDFEMKLSSVHNELHEHYQKQFDEVFSQRSVLLQQKLEKCEIDIRQNFSNKLQSQKYDYDQAITQIVQRHKMEVNEIETKHESSLTGFKEEVKSLKQENLMLRKQQEGVAAAVAAILTPSATPIIQDLNNPDQILSSRSNSIAGSKSESSDSIQNKNFPISLTNKNNSFLSNNKQFPNLVSGLPRLIETDENKILNLRLSSSTSSSYSTASNEEMNTVREVYGEKIEPLATSETKNVLLQNVLVNSNKESHLKLNKNSSIEKKFQHFNPNTELTEDKNEQKIKKVNVAPPNFTLFFNPAKNDENDLARSSKTELSFQAKRILKADEILNRSNITSSSSSDEDFQHLRSLNYQVNNILLNFVPK